MHTDFLSKILISNNHTINLIKDFFFKKPLSLAQVFLCASYSIFNALICAHFVFFWLLLCQRESCWVTLSSSPLSSPYLWSHPNSATPRSRNAEPTAPCQLHDATRHFKDYILRTLQLKEARALRQVASDLKTKNSSSQKTRLSLQHLKLARQKCSRWNLHQKPPATHVAIVLSYSKPFCTTLITCFMSEQIECQSGLPCITLLSVLFCYFSSRGSKISCVADVKPV